MEPITITLIPLYLAFIISLVFNFAGLALWYHYHFNLLDDAEWAGRTRGLSIAREQRQRSEGCPCMRCVDSS